MRSFNSVYTRVGSDLVDYRRCEKCESVSLHIPRDMSRVLKRSGKLKRRRLCPDAIFHGISTRVGSDLVDYSKCERCTSLSWHIPRDVTCHLLSNLPDRFNTRDMSRGMCKDTLSHFSHLL